MGNLIYDKALSFGTMTAFATAAKYFDNILNLGKKDGSTDTYPGKEYTNADRLTVDICYSSTTGGSTTVTVEVLGSASDTLPGTWGKVGVNTFTLDELKAGPCKVAISPNKYKYLRVSVIASAAADGAAAEAFLNTYAGK